MEDLQDWYRNWSVIMEKLEKDKDPKGVIATIWVTLDRDLAMFEASLSAVRSLILRVGASVNLPRK